MKSCPRVEFWSTDIGHSYPIMGLHIMMIRIKANIAGKIVRKGGAKKMTENEKKEKQTKTMEQKMIVTERNTLELQGVQKVEDFDKHEIYVETRLGNLQIKGEDLHIAQLLLEEEALMVTGTIQSVAFVEERGSKTRHKKGKSLLERITK